MAIVEKRPPAEKRPPFRDQSITEKRSPDGHQSFAGKRPPTAQQLPAEEHLPDGQQRPGGKRPPTDKDLPSGNEPLEEKDPSAGKRWWAGKRQASPPSDGPPGKPLSVEEEANPTIDKARGAIYGLCITEALGAVANWSPKTKKVYMIGGKKVTREEFPPVTGFGPIGGPPDLPTG